MIDERELENRIERIPAAPDRLLVIRHYTVQPESVSAFVGMWHAFATEQARQDGCLLQRLHSAIEKPDHYVTYDLWKSRLALVGALRRMEESPSYPLSGAVHQTFVRLISHVPGQIRDANRVKPGQVASVRYFTIKVTREPDFERLWIQSAQSEQGHLYKRLHCDLNYPQRYMSYSLWPTAQASDHATAQHSHWQAEHEPYPLSSGVIKEMLEVLVQL